MEELLQQFIRLDEQLADHTYSPVASSLWSRYERLRAEVGRRLNGATAIVNGAVVVGAVEGRAYVNRNTVLINSKEASDESD